MLEFENLMSETDPFRLDAGKYRLSWRAEKMGIAFLEHDLGDGRHRYLWRSDHRQGVTRPVELAAGDYRIVLSHGTSGLHVTIKEE
jgi:hypothetical protein